MGKLLSKIWKNQEARILFLGLDAAGKTSILYRLKLGEVVTTIPTIGFNVESITHKKVNITAWDVGGRDKIRPLYRHYFQNTQAVVFVVDSTDRDRITEAMEELGRMVGEDELAEAVFAIVANKSDLPSAMTQTDVEIHVRKVPWKPSMRFKTFTTSAVTGEGLYESLEWLIDQIALGKTAQHLMLKTENSTTTSTPPDKDKTASSYFTDLYSQIRKMFV